MTQERLEPAEHKCGACGAPLHCQSTKFFVHFVFAGYERPGFEAKCRKKANHDGEHNDWTRWDCRWDANGLTVDEREGK